MQKFINVMLVSFMTTMIIGIAGCNQNKCVTPVFSPSAGTFTSDQSISISTTTQGATIHYTTNGSTPSSSSAVYTAPISVAGNGTSITIKAIAVKSGNRNSRAASGTFTVNYPQVAVPQITPAPVLFSSAQTITITCATSGATIRYTTDNSDPSATAGTVIASGGSFTLSATGTVKAISYKTGMLTSSITSVAYTFHIPVMQWTWISGDNIVNQAGNYGIKGTGSTLNKPGAREESLSWTDVSGNLWLFGGASAQAAGGYDYMNDLWKFEPSTLEWTWVSGDSAGGQPGVYGTKGVGSTSNKPEGRWYSTSWTDSSGNLWLFGGEGYSTDAGFEELNDLWKFEPSTGAWTWVSGSNTSDQAGIYGEKGVGSTSNIPGGRSQHTSWIDSSGNAWIFGGVAEVTDAGGDINDLWKFEPSSGKWTWASGSDIVYQPGVYGTKGTGSLETVPGARDLAVSWTDSSDNLWLFGGYGIDSTGTTLSLLNDLWKFEPSTGKWTWVSGDNTQSQHGVYGTKGTADAANKPGARAWSMTWTDAFGSLWLFGGFGFDGSGGNGALNDLWKFEPPTGKWTWVSGDNTAEASGVYGTKGTADASNIPGSRGSSSFWIDSSNNLWLFGGYGFDSTDAQGDMNDLWKFEP